MDLADWSPRTRAVAAGRPQEPGEPLNTPIVPVSTFHAGGARAYSREDGTPSWTALEEAIGGLEGGHATAFASGIATAAAVIDLLPVGAEVAVPRFSYAGTRGLLGHAAKNGRLRAVELEPSDLSAWTAAAEWADLVWLESPTNPTLDVIDIRAVARAADGHLAKVVVDNTFATPLGQQPLDLGADIVVHSATKLIGGHSDLLLGLTVTRDEELATALRDARTRNGATPGALEAYLALRGLRTLPVRLAEASRSAELLADRLGTHPKVTRVRYPGSGQMIAFELDSAEAADAVCGGLRLIRHATSLGGVESCVERRAWLAGDAHVPPGLIRFSVGLEDPEDLWRDLREVLDRT
ncbi:PLP-dependent aspartate aminotransferase family protein [Amycolatopsis sp. 195334CR]|uniref:trans-sulfuration enzyme family protein n=1 Tax=Amycolatopsis sp. 195334CR TaxID=2814588 RepID=UPI001A9052E8|nr:PLP-dependent aspartate aminotransferase family protein [Amycolatopsis sp. 195334CR]MBN6035536.1 PLP-dependent transferase [Amycolatopsis sp. 195334CR]